MQELPVNRTITHKDSQIRGEQKQQNLRITHEFEAYAENQLTNGVNSAFISPYFSILI